jgi:hypothetical protein
MEHLFVDTVDLKQQLKFPWPCIGREGQRYIDRDREREREREGGREGGSV